MLGDLEESLSDLELKSYEYQYTFGGETLSCPKETREIFCCQHPQFPLDNWLLKGSRGADDRSLTIEAGKGEAESGLVTSPITDSWSESAG